VAAAIGCDDSDATTSATGPPPPPVDPCPAIAAAGPGFASVAAYANRTRALRRDGTAICWGKEYYGGECLASQPGSAPTQYPTPVESLGLSCLSSLSEADESGAALTARGEALLWSDNLGGELNPTEPFPNEAGMPIHRIAGLGWLNAIRTGKRGAAAIDLEGRIWRWGFLWNRIEEPERVAVPGTVLAYDLGIGHLCAVNDRNEVWCVGSNYWAQLGDGTTTERLAPVQPSGLPAASGIALAGGHSCAITTEGAIWCWGWDTGGFGRGVVPGQDEFIATAVPTSPLPAAVKVDISPSGGCAVTVDGDLYCWGHTGGRFSQDPDIDFLPDPTLVPEPGKVVDVAVGAAHACVVRVDGAVWCAGDSAMVGSVRAPDDTSWGPIAAQ